MGRVALFEVVIVRHQGSKTKEFYSISKNMFTHKPWDIFDEEVVVVVHDWKHEANHVPIVYNRPTGYIKVRKPQLQRRMRPFHVIANGRLTLVISYRGAYISQYEKGMASFAPSMCALRMLIEITCFSTNKCGLSSKGPSNTPGCARPIDSKVSC